MAAIGAPMPAPIDWTREARESVREALKHPAVAAVAILAGAAVTVVVVGGLVWLAWAQRDASTVLNLVSLLLNAFLYKRVTDMDSRVRVVETQTNGTNKRLMDHALKTGNRGD